MIRSSRLAATITASALVAVTTAGPSPDRASASSRVVRPGVAEWQTWVLPEAGQFRAGPPPGPRSRKTRKELAQIRRLQRVVSKGEKRLIKRWSRDAATLPWTEVALDMIIKHRPGAFPTRSARALGLLHVGMYDAMVAASDSAAQYPRKRPFRVDRDIDRHVRAGGRSYPDPTSAIGGAAETILTYLFPQESPTTFARLANQATRSRLLAGVNYRSDVQQGREMGRRVGELVVAYAATDGTQASPDTVLATNPCPTLDCNDSWVPTPIHFQYPPTDPAASTWKTWLLQSPGQFLPPPPPAYGSQQFIEELQVVYEANNNSSQSQKQLAYFWDDGPGTYSPAGHWNQIAVSLIRSAKLKTPSVARIFALMNSAIVDAFIATWDAKYYYWSIRPVSVIRYQDMIGGTPNPVYDPGWLPNVDTPPFPAYTSGHAAESAAAARVLQYFFPDKGQDPNALVGNYGTAGILDAIADEVALSRLIGGIHYPSDNSEALILGRKVADLAIQRAQTDGAGL